MTLSVTRKLLFRLLLLLFFMSEEHTSKYVVILFEKIKSMLIHVTHVHQVATYGRVHYALGSRLVPDLLAKLGIAKFYGQTGGGVLEY